MTANSRDSGHHVHLFSDEDSNYGWEKTTIEEPQFPVANWNSPLPFHFMQQQIISQHTMRLHATTDFPLLIYKYECHASNWCFMAGTDISTVWSQIGLQNALCEDGCDQDQWAEYIWTVISHNLPNDNLQYSIQYIEQIWGIEYGQNFSQKAIKRTALPRIGLVHLCS